MRRPGPTDLPMTARPPAESAGWSLLPKPAPVAGPRAFGLTNEEAYGMELAARIVTLEIWFSNVRRGAATELTTA